MFTLASRSHRLKNLPHGNQQVHLIKNLLNLNQCLAEVYLGRCKEKF